MVSLTLRCDNSKCWLLETLLNQQEIPFQQLATVMPGVSHQMLMHPNGSVSFPFINSNCLSLFEINPQTVQEEADALLSLIHTGDRLNFELSLATAAITLKRWIWKGRVILPSGATKWIEVLSQPVLQANGDILWNGLFINITPQM